MTTPEHDNAEWNAFAERVAREVIEVDYMSQGDEVTSQYLEDGVDLFYSLNKSASVRESARNS